MKSITRHQAILGGAPCVALLALLATAPVACGGGESAEGDPAETTGSGGGVTTGGGTGGAGGMVTPCDPDEDPDGCWGTGGSGGGGEPAPPGIDWSGGFGDTNDQQGLAVAVDSMGNTVVTGGFMGTINFGGSNLTADGESDVFVAKFDPAGNHLWSKQFGNSLSQRGRGIACDSADNILVTGHFVGSINFGGPALNAPVNDTNNLFVAKLDPVGNHLWSQSYGNAASQVGYAVAVDPADNVLVAGRMQGVINFGGNTLTASGADDDALVLKLSPGGTPMWGGRFGAAGDQYAHGVAGDAAGNILLTGKFNGVVNFGNGNLTSNGWPANTSPDLFFAVFGANGSPTCAFDAGNSGAESGRAVAVGPDGNAYVTGSFDSTIGFNMGAISLSSAGSNDVFIAKIGPDCNTMWANRFGNNGDQVAYGISVDGEGAPWIIGDFTGAINFGGGDLTTSGNYDIFAARFTPSGTHLFSGKAGDSAAQGGRGIAGGPGGYASLTGYYQGNMGWTGHPVLSGGANNNVFVSRLVP